MSIRVHAYWRFVFAFERDSRLEMMGKWVRAGLAAVTGLMLTAWASADDRLLRDGDLIFQASQSAQSGAIREASQRIWPRGARYTHVGVVFKELGQWVVYEAIQPVTRTPIRLFIARGAGRHYVVRRLRDDVHALTVADRERLRRALSAYLGKPYDVFFEWSEQAIYCSELVWKAYATALGTAPSGFELTPLERLGDLALDGPLVRSLILRRYEGTGRSPNPDETLISPAALYESTRLETVFDSNE